MPVEANCPSCDAGIVFGSNHGVLAVCGHCRSSIVRTDKDLKNLGRMADLLEDASPIRFGTEGRPRPADPRRPGPPLARGPTDRGGSAAA